MRGLILGSWRLRFSISGSSGARGFFPSSCFQEVGAGGMGMASTGEAAIDDGAVQQFHEWAVFRLFQCLNGELLWRVLPALARDYWTGGREARVMT